MHQRLLVVLAADAGGIAEHAGSVARWRELYRGQYSPVMMRLGGAIVAVGGGGWLAQRLRG